jgi:hypothetical protein
MKQRIPSTTPNSTRQLSGTELEQARRNERLAAQLRTNLKRRKSGHSTPKTDKPEMPGKD